MQATLPFPSKVSNKNGANRSYYCPGTNTSQDISDVNDFICCHAIHSHVKFSILPDNNLLLVLVFWLKRFIDWLIEISCNAKWSNVNTNCFN